MNALRQCDRPNIVVYGVGHSGTTILTKMLFALGWNPGESADAADEEFAENVAVRECNRHALDHQELPAHARSLLERLRSPWVIKDPRFAMTLPLWQKEFAAAAGEMPTLLWLTRELDEVKRSYVRRNETAGGVAAGHGKTIEELWEAADRHYQAWEGPKLQLAYEAMDAAATLFVPSGQDKDDRPVSSKELVRRLGQYARDNEALGKTILSLKEELRKSREDRTGLDFQLQQLESTVAAYRTLLDQREAEIEREARRQIQRVAVSYSVPADAILLVVSRGDEDLVTLQGRTAWHFPQTPDGTFAGCYPATGGEAIAHLEELRGKGASYLLFPWAALWWLEYYAEFRQHLDRNYRLAGPAEKTCLIYDLRGKERQK